MSFSFKDKQIVEVPPHRTGNIGRCGVRDPVFRHRAQSS